MAVTVSLYNNTVKRLVNQEVDFTALKMMLLDATASFTATHTALTDVAGASHDKEVFGNGWTEGGELLASVAVTTIATNDAKLDAADISVTATGGPIGPATAAVIYDDTDAADAPLAYIDFGGEEQAGESTDFKVVWHTDGIFKFTYA